MPLPSGAILDKRDGRIAPCDDHRNAVFKGNIVNHAGKGVLLDPHFKGHILRLQQVAPVALKEATQLVVREVFLVIVSI